MYAKNSVVFFAMLWHSLRLFLRIWQAPKAARPGAYPYPFFKGFMLLQCHRWDP